MDMDSSSSAEEEEAMETTTTTGSGCEIGRLLEELLASIISLVPSPRDACRAAAVSRPFRAAADSDAVWSRFLPLRDLPRFAEEEPLARAPPPSKKGLFRRLSDQPALLEGKLMSMWLDRATGAQCYAFCARALHISWGDAAPPCHWGWIDLAPDDHIPRGNSSLYSFPEFEAARDQVLDVCWSEIRAKIHTRMLSHNTAYAAYMVFKLLGEAGFYSLDFPYQEASVSVGGNESTTRRVCLQCCVEGDRGHRMIEPAYGRARAIPPGDLEYVVLPRRREDGWMELELAEFYNEEGDDGEVSISLMQTVRETRERGPFVCAIEIRTKQQQWS